MWAGQLNGFAASDMCNTRVVMCNAPTPHADIRACLSTPNCPSCPAEVYVNETVGQRPVVTWNMELDTLRSDLGEGCIALLVVPFAWNREPRPMLPSSLQASVGSCCEVPTGGQGLAATLLSVAWDPTDIGF